MVPAVLFTHMPWFWRVVMSSVTTGAAMVKAAMERMVAKIESLMFTMGWQWLVDWYVYQELIMMIARLLPWVYIELFRGWESYFGKGSPGDKE